jgi:methionine biosynthesis protein MetW
MVSAVHRDVQPEQAVDRLLSAIEKGRGLGRGLVIINPYLGNRALKQTLESVPERLLPLVEEIAVFVNASDRVEGDEPADPRGRPIWNKLRIYRNPRDYAYGDNLKSCFDYAIERAFDYVVLLRGDGRHDPSRLPLFLLTALEHSPGAVLAQRSLRLGRMQAGWFDLVRLVGYRAVAAFEQLILQMNLADYHAGYRLLTTDVIRRIPYQLNEPDYLFDLQLLIQIRCLGVDIRTVQVPDFHDPGLGGTDLAWYALRAAWISVAYRLHQLHVKRDGAYLVDLGVRYQLKRNRLSSHMQILDSIKPGSRVLDLGCGQSLLAEEYAGKGVTLVGVDEIPAEQVSSAIHQYFRTDLEQPLELPFGRDFDYVILSDVIEHIRNRDAMMHLLRRHLKLGGRLIISTGNIAIWFYRLSLLLGRFEYGPRGILDQTHVHLFTLDSFRRFVEKSGYRIIETAVTPLPFELVFSSTGRSRTLDRITQWYHYLSRLWPGLFAYQFIIHCTFQSYEFGMGEQMLVPEPASSNEAVTPHKDENSSPEAPSRPGPTEISLLRQADDDASQE